MVRKISLSKPESNQATNNEPYDLFFPDDVRKQLSNAKKKDKELARQLVKRFEKLRISPECGETLSHDKAGYREVHVKDHWVIIYKIDYIAHTVVILKFGIHEKVLGK